MIQIMQAERSESDLDKNWKKKKIKPSFESGRTSIGVFAGIVKGGRTEVILVRKRGGGGKDRLVTIPASPGDTCST